MIDEYPDESKQQWFDAYPQLDLTHTAYKNALTSLYSIWGYQVDSDSISCKQANSIQLTCYSQKMNLKQLKQLNYRMTANITRTTSD